MTAQWITEEVIKVKEAMGVSRSQIILVSINEEQMGHPCTVDKPMRHRQEKTAAIRHREASSELDSAHNSNLELPSSRTVRKTLAF